MNWYRRRLKECFSSFLPLTTAQVHAQNAYFAQAA